MSEYVTVTELPGISAHKEQIERLFQRYRFASEYCKDKDVLEVACGGGIGLGYLARIAKKVVGGDIDENILKYPRNYYKGKKGVEIKTLDAQSMQFNNNSFDVVIMYEAIYYLPNPEKFIEEAHRILRKNGVLIICTVNKDWPGFNPSPHSFKYFSVPELHSLYEKNDFKIKMFAGFPEASDSVKGNLISVIKQLAVKFHLIPKTMKGKEKLKRLFFGKLQPIPSEVTDGLTDYIPPVSLPSDKPDTNHKVLYAVGYV